MRFVVCLFDRLNQSCVENLRDRATNLHNVRFSIWRAGIGNTSLFMLDWHGFEFTIASFLLPPHFLPHSSQKMPARPRKLKN
jgi:hypothetical protein